MTGEITGSFKYFIQWKNLSIYWASFMSIQTRPCWRRAFGSQMLASVKPEKRKELDVVPREFGLNSIQFWCLPSGVVSYCRTLSCRGLPEGWVIPNIQHIVGVQQAGFLPLLLLLCEEGGGELSPGLPCLGVNLAPSLKKYFY